MPIKRIRPSIMVIIASCSLLLGGITACSSSNSTVVEQKTEINPSGSTSETADAKGVSQPGSTVAATSPTADTGQTAKAMAPGAAASLTTVTREKLVDMPAAMDLSKGSGTVTIK